MAADVPFICFLSDYGLEDEFVGVCHGVIARRCPAARVIDVTHSIPRHDVRAGALMLRDVLPFLPDGVCLAVVDPGVGASGEQARRAVALRTAKEGRLLVGPDNGLLMPAADALGGVAEAVDVGESAERLQPVSATFHGRDVFAPVAAALARGASLAEVGMALDLGLLRKLELSCATIADGALLARVIAIDRFGNVALDATPAQLEEIGVVLGARAAIERTGTQAAFAVQGEGRMAVRCRTFADVPPGALLLHEDSRGMVALAVNEGSAAGLLGVSREDELTVRPA